MKMYRRLKHKIETDEKYYKGALVVLGTLIVLDILMLWLVW